MSWKKAGLALLAAMLLAPAAHADVTITPDEELAAINPEGTATIGFTASLACSELVPGVVTGGGSQSESLTLTYPEGLTGPETVDLSFSGSPCASNPTGSTTTTGSIDVTALASAPGMEALNIAAASHDTAAGALTVQVGYRMGHSFIVDVEFPLEVGDEPVTWNGTLTVTANADTMVMTLKEKKSEYGTVSGIFDFKNFRDIPAEGSTETIMFTYTPASQGWETDSSEFIMWSHYINDGAMKTPDETINWTFVNTQSADEEPAKGSPGFGVVALMGLLGAAAVTLRRRD